MKINVKTNTTTPISTTAPTPDTSVNAVVSNGVVFIAKSLVGIIAASAVTVLTSKLLKTGESQKKYEEAIKEFTSK